MNRVSYQLSLTLKLFLLSQGTPAVLHCSFAPCPRQERLLAGRLSVYRCISMSDAEPRLHQRVPMLSSAVDSCFNELTLVAPGYGDSLSFCPFPHEACISHLLYHFIKHIQLGSQSVEKTQHSTTQHFSQLAVSFGLLFFFYVWLFCSSTTLSFHLSSSFLPYSSCRHDGIPRRITMTPDLLPLGL